MSEKTHFGKGRNFILETDTYTYVGRVYQDCTVGVVKHSSKSHERVWTQHLRVVPDGAERIRHSGEQDDWKLSPLVWLLMHEKEICARPFEKLSL